MSFSIGQLVGFVKIDHSGVRTGMADAEREVKTGSARMGQQADRGGKDIGAKFGNGIKSNVRSSFDDISKSWKTLGAGLLAGLAVGGVVDFFKDAVDGASNLEQSIGGVDAVFGKYAANVHAKSEQAAQDLGLSKNAYNELITVSAAMLKNKGLEDFAAQSEKLVGVGADLAAQFGGSTKDAVEALNAAMRGESDPIERYGISLNEAAVNAKMAQLGLTGLTGAALEQAKTQARLALITDQSKDSLGAFGRESDTLAGKQQRLAAEWENQKTAIGQQLMPVMVGLSDFVAGTLLPAFTGLVDALVQLGGVIGSIPGPVKAAVGALVAFHLLKGPLASMLDTARLKSMYAGDAIRNMGGAGGAAKKGLGSLMGMLGNPWLLALGGATIAFMAWQAEAEKTDALAAKLAGTIDKATNSFNEQGKAAIKQSLLDALSAEDITRVQEMGISFDEMTAAVLAGGPALQQFRDKLAGLGAEKAGVFGNADSRAIDGVNAALGRAGEATERTRVVTAAMATTTKDAAGAQDDLAGATDGAGGSAAGAAPKAKTYADNVADLATKTDEAAKLQQDLADAMLEVVDAASGADSAAIDYNKSLDDAQDRVAKRIELEKELKAATDPKDRARIREELDAYTKGLDINTEAGRGNKQALIDLAAQARDAAKASLENDESVKSVADTMATRRQDFLDTAKALGVNKDEAKKMADEYGLTKPYVDNLSKSLGAVPKEVTSKLQVERDEAVRKLAEFKRILAGVRDKTVTISAIYQVTGSLQQANAAANQRRLDQNVNDRRFGGRVPGYAGGTLIGPGTGTSDSIRAFVRETGKALNVSTGEFLSTDSSRKRNLAALEAGNRGATLEVAGRGGPSGTVELGRATIAAIVAGVRSAPAGEVSLKRIEKGLA